MALRDLHAKDESRYSFDDFAKWKQFAGASFPTGVGAVAIGPNGKKAERSDDLVLNYKTNATVFACMLLRQSVFAEITFRYVGMSDGKVGKFFGGPNLEILERPWPNGTTGELATRMIQDVDLTGNFYAVERGGRLYRRDPRFTYIVLDGNPLESEFVDVAGYVYQPQGPVPGAGQTFTYLPNEMCHWSPLPDPFAQYRGMSWITPVLREIQADRAASNHQIEFFENGATPNFAVTFPEAVMNEEEFDRFKKKMNDDYNGPGNAYKTLYLAPGADVKTVGVKLSELDYDEFAAINEQRITAAAGVPPSLIGTKESLKGSSLNAGNYQAARRRFADATMRPLYRSGSAALQVLAPPPNSNSKLWYDDSQVAFFREDRGDQATIEQTKSTTIMQLVNSGYTPLTVVQAVEQEDMTLLEHSGLFSVQLQPPSNGTTANDPEADQPVVDEPDPEPDPADGGTE